MEFFLMESFADVQLEKVFCSLESVVNLNSIGSDCVCEWLDGERFALEEIFTFWTTTRLATHSVGPQPASTCLIMPSLTCLLSLCSRSCLQRVVGTASQARRLYIRWVLKSCLLGSIYGCYSLDRFVIVMPACQTFGWSTARSPTVAKLR